MAKIELESLGGGPFGGCSMWPLVYTYDGVKYTDDGYMFNLPEGNHKLVRMSCDTDDLTEPTFQLTEKHVRWAFVTPNLTDEEKASLVAQINAYYLKLDKSHCERCRKAEAQRKNEENMRAEAVKRHIAACLANYGKTRKTSKFEFIGLSTKCCNGYVRYAYEGKEYVTETEVLVGNRYPSYPCERCGLNWTIDDIKWTTEHLEWPFPESERQGFVDMVNEQINPLCFADCSLPGKCLDDWIVMPPQSNEYYAESDRWIKQSAWTVHVEPGAVVDISEIMEYANYPREYPASKAHQKADGRKLILAITCAIGGADCPHGMRFDTWGWNECGYREDDLQKLEESLNNWDEKVKTHCPGCPNNTGMPEALQIADCKKRGAPKKCINFLSQPDVDTLLKDV